MCEPQLKNLCPHIVDSVAGLHVIGSTERTTRQPEIHRWKSMEPKKLKEGGVVTMASASASAPTSADLLLEFVRNDSIDTPIEIEFRGEFKIVISYLSPNERKLWLKCII